MASTNLGDIYLVTINGLLFGQRTMTTFQYRVASLLGAGPWTVQDVYVNLEDRLLQAGGLVPDYAACCPIEWTYQSTWIQRISPNRVIKYVTTDALVAAKTGNTTVSNLQASITRRSEFANRAGVGGIRVPLASDQVLDGIIIEPLLVKLDNLAQEMLVTYTMAGVAALEPVLYSPPKGDPPIGHLEPVYQAFVQHQARTINRRTVGRGI